MLSFFSFSSFLEKKFVSRSNNLNEHGSSEFSQKGQNLVYQKFLKLSPFQDIFWTPHTTFSPCNTAPPSRKGGIKSAVYHVRERRFISTWCKHPIPTLPAKSSLESFLASFPVIVKEGLSPAFILISFELRVPCRNISYRRLTDWVVTKFNFKFLWNPFWNHFRWFLKVESLLHSFN